MSTIMQYSNGWGHLIMSVFFGLAGLALILDPATDSTMKGVGVSLILTVAGAWFVPGAAKQMAYQVVQDKSIPTDPPAPAPAQAPAPAGPPSA